MKIPSGLKTIICCKAARYAGLPATKAASKAYECLTDSQYEAICKYFPSYEQDYGDAAVAAFTRWIRRDRRNE